MRDNVEYIKSHVNTYIGFQPELQNEIAKALLSLLKIRKIKDYFTTSLTLLNLLECKIQEGKILKIKSSKKETNRFVSFSEIIKAGILFSEITDDEAAVIKLFLEELIPTSEDTLEQYMLSKLGLKTSELYNAEERSLDQSKITIIALEVFNSDKLENFKLNSDEKISDAKIEEIIVAYFTKEGYTRNQKDYYSSYSFYKKDEELGINVTNWSYSIMVTVARIPAIILQN